MRSAAALVCGNAFTRRPRWTLASAPVRDFHRWPTRPRSEEHTSELQSLRHLVCRLLVDNDTATTDIYPLSLHDALPIYGNAFTRRPRWTLASAPVRDFHRWPTRPSCSSLLPVAGPPSRSGKRPCG